MTQYEESANHRYHLPGSVVPSEVPNSEGIRRVLEKLSNDLIGIIGLISRFSSRIRPVSCLEGVRSKGFEQDIGRILSGGGRCPVQAAIDHWSAEPGVLAWKMPGAGGGGYLACVVSDAAAFCAAHPEAIPLTIRRPGM